MTAHPWEPVEAQAEVADYLQEQLDYGWPVCDLDDTGLHAIDT